MSYMYKTRKQKGNDKETNIIATCILSLTPKAKGKKKNGKKVNLRQNTELNDLGKIICLRNLKFLLKEVRFVMSLKIWRSCH